VECLKNAFYLQILSDFCIFYEKEHLACAIRVRVAHHAQIRAPVSGVQPPA
jgi:hypothetical protein